MKKKMKRFNGEEGSEIEFESKTGRNENIDDETRARARKFVEDKEETKVAPKTTKTSAPTPKASTSTPKESAPAPKAEAKPKPETKEEYTTRMEGLAKKQALERVEPENYIPGSGMLKAGLKAIVGAGARKAAKEGTEAGVKESAKQIANNPTKRIGLDKDTYKSATEKAREARANARMNKMHQENYDAGPAGRARASGAPYDYVPKQGELRSDFKKGGKIKSASSRADGCAVRGKTRA
jgi:hypothetical protein